MTRSEGHLFVSSQVYGVVEPDFFDWLVEVEGGEQFVRVLARRLSRFAWRDVEHDILKVLYESIISSSQRKQLGEYYTPDWLAERVVDATVTDPLGERVLDPACGSGTFIFHAVRRYLEAACAKNISNGTALAGLTQHVIGMDIHPVAVTFARVTYLLAIGPERLQAGDRPPISIPVYLGDSIQWGQGRTLFTSDALVIPTGAGQLWASELRFPQRVLADAGRFDQLVGEPENRVDVLVGNPPWLAYRFMTTSMQNEFRNLSEERQLWGGAKVATSQDLSPLFVLRAVERYLKEGGRFGFLMPWSTLRGRQYAGFRSGRYGVKNQFTLNVAFSQAWDLHGVKPTFFPMPASAVFGRRSDDGTAKSLGSTVKAWKGKLQQVNVTWALAAPQIATRFAVVKTAGSTTTSAGSPYASRFLQGATLVPRVLLFVDKKSAGPLGAGFGRVSVQSRRSANEKEPWKNIKPGLEGKVERQFVHTVHMGETILPYRTLPPVNSVIPWDGQRLLHSGDERLEGYPGLFEWWTKAEKLWNTYRRSERLTLHERIDYQRGLSQQFPISKYRIVYAKSGLYLAASILTEPAVIEQTLYWATAHDLQEARYLEAIINSDALTQLLRPLQARGEHNPRHYAKDIWQIKIPVFDHCNDIHMRLVSLAAEAEALAAGVSLPQGKRFETLRRIIRGAINATKTGRQIEKTVEALLQ